MPRAALHNALVLDREIYEASKVDASLLDPIVRVEGGLPGSARPIAVVRDYQGPQGASVEYFVLADGRGREIVRSATRRIELRGEMFEDRFVDVINHVRIERGDEHAMTFFVNDQEVATIPVFVESGLGGDPVIAAKETLNKALSKGMVVWLTIPAAEPTSRKSKPKPHTQPVWYVWTDGKVYVLDGPTEQQVPGLPQAEQVMITARSKDLRSRVSDIPASVAVIPNDTEQFDLIARMALGRRLNLPDGDGALERWRSRCVLLELTPDFGEERAKATTGGAAATNGAAADGAAAEGGDAPAAKAAEEDIHVEAQVDQAVFDQLIADGKSERVARAKAKAAYVRAEKARIRAERESAG
jgi:hypothetical protein